jgi:DNA polymerase-3 subunit delta
MVSSWIEEYLREKGVQIVPEAALLIAEHIGTELRKLVQELNKIVSNLDDRKKIDLIVVEENTGISREYNVFELTKAISFRDSGKAFRIVRKFGASPRQNPLVMTLAALFSHFTRLLKYHSILQENKSAGRGQIASAIGVNPYFLTEYDRASRNYPLIKCMEAISMIRRYDSVSKSNERGEASDGELLAELVFRIMN